MNKKIVIKSQLNTYFQTAHNIERDKNELDEDWIKFRIKLFKDYCLKSMKAQTNQLFNLLLACRRETVPFIKKEMGELPDNINITSGGEFDNEVNELSKGHDVLYLVRVDSDDMWEKHFIELLHNYIHKPETEVLINQYCYNYDINSGRLASFFYKSPQSYVLVYKPEEYARGKRHRLLRGHGGAILKKYEIIPGFNYMDTVHGKNIVSIFHPMTWDQWKEIEDKDDIKNILERFGLPGEKELRDEDKR